MNSQIFVAICLFFLIFPFSLCAYGAIRLLTATKEEVIEKSKRMFKVAIVMMILILVTIYAEMQNPTNPTTIYTEEDAANKIGQYIPLEPSISRQ